MRRTKREIIAAEASGDEDMLTAKSILLRRQREEYAKFSKEAGLLTQNERTQVYGFGKSVAQKARWKAQKALDNGGGSGIINIRKSVEIPKECIHILKADTNFKDKNVSADVIKTINNTIDKRLAEKADFVFNEIKVGRFQPGDKSVFITNLEDHGSSYKTQLYLNKDYFIGSSEETINSFCAELYNKKWWKSKSLGDLVNHEIMHAKINYHNSYEKIDRLYQTLREDYRVKGFCGLVDKYPDEFLNEMYVALNNGEAIDKKYITVYNEHVKEFLGG